MGSVKTLLPDGRADADGVSEDGRTDYLFNADHP